MIQIGWLKKTRNNLHKHRLANLKNRLKWKQKVMDVKTDIYKDSHSLLWIWEFSKKAVMICFMFYVVVQIYSMVVMVKYCDLTHLGELITKTGDIVENCVFGYLVKAGVENVCKIVFSEPSEDEAVG